MTLMMMMLSRSLCRMAACAHSDEAFLTCVIYLFCEV
jgi:hypothetical protein